MNHHHHQIPGFRILVIFVTALGLAVSNKTFISQVSRVLAATVAWEDLPVVPVRVEEEEEEEEAEIGPIDHQPETAREQDEESTPLPKVPKCLVNLHIPKVGGRTVGTFLQQVLNVTGFERYPLYGHKNETVWEDIVSAKRMLQSDDGRVVDNHNNSEHSSNGNDATKKEYYEQIFIQGHFTTRIFDLYPELRKECLIMTVLREPVDRAISAFFFHKHKRNQIDKCLSQENYNRKSHAAGNSFVEVEANEEEEEDSSPGLIIQRGNATILLSKPTTVGKQDAKIHLAQARINAQRRIRRLRGDVHNSRCNLFWQYSNDMTRRFAGLPELPWKCWEMKEPKGRKFRDRSRLPQGTSIGNYFDISSIPRTNETHLERAKENMKNSLGLVCFLHDLSSCAERILEAFQVDASEIDISMMSTNTTTRWKTKQRPDRLEEEELQKFQKANRLDQELYEWALEMYS